MTSKGSMSRASFFSQSAIRLRPFEQGSGERELGSLYAIIIIYFITIIVIIIIIMIKSH